MFASWLTAAGSIFAERRSFRPVVRFLARGALHPRPTVRLLRFLADRSQPALPRPVQVDSLLKPGRAHVRHGLSAAERADLLIAHHAALRRAMRPDLLQAFLAGVPLRLAGIEGRDGAEAFDVLLSRAPFGYRREGEVTLSVRARSSGVRLADVTFIIGGSAQRAACLRIGGVQGPPAPHGKDAVKAATKALDGWRPKAVAIEALYGLAHGLGAASLFATALSHHVLRGTRKAAMLHAGPYDAFWQELGALHLANGDYLLPHEPPHRDAAEVPAKRRKDWERRQLRIATLGDDIARAMAAWHSPAAPARPTSNAGVAEYAVWPPRSAAF
jgi:uncharacterized protein VirK/YbjX